MRNLINNLLRLWIKIALHGYFDKIIIRGVENIPSGKPIIIVSNHQNALLDPLLLATHIKLKPYFLTRASVFANPFLSKLLNYIRLLPVYRIRDGFGNIFNNQKTFEQTFDVLRKNGTVVIFAEGNHSINRNVRPLSKGFTRIAFGVKEKYQDVKPVILPVGFDYSCHLRSGGKVLLSFGEPIPVDMPATQSAKLTLLVSEALKKLVVHIPEENYQKTLEQLIQNSVDLISKNDIDEFLVTGTVKNPVPNSSSLRNKLMKIFHFPLHWAWLWKKRTVHDHVFSSTWKFLIGLVWIGFWYLGLIWMSLQSPLGSWTISFLILGWITLWFNRNPQE